MRRLGHVVYISLIAMTAFTTYQFVSAQNEHDMVHEDVNGTNSEITNDASERAIAPTRDTLTDHVTHHASISSPEPTPTHSATSPPDDSDSNEWMLLRIEALEAELQEYRQTLTRLSHLQRSLDNERIVQLREKGRDFEWATEVELDLETLFIRDERLRTIQIDEMQCFSEHCELTLSHMEFRDGFPTQYFSQLINQEPRLAAHNFGVMSIGNGESTQLTLSIIDEGQP